MTLLVVSLSPKGSQVSALPTSFRPTPDDAILDKLTDGSMGGGASKVKFDRIVWIAIMSDYVR